MGQSSSKAAEISASSLLQPAMEGKIDDIKKIVDQYIAQEKQKIQTEGEKGPNNDDNDKTVNVKLKEFINTACDGQGNTALHGAVFGGHLELTKYLCEECCANILQKNIMGCSSVWLAAGYNHDPILMYFLDKMVTMPTNNDQDGSGDTSSSSSSSPLQMALVGPDCVNSTGDTPFIAAASKGNTNICKILLDATMASNDDDNGGLELAMQMFHQTNNGGDTAFSVAVASAQDDIFTILLDWYSKHKDKATKTEHTSLAFLNQVNQKGLNPLIIACERGNTNVLNRLLSFSDHLEYLPDKDGASPLSVASFCGHIDVVQAILENKPELLNQPDDPSGCTPLWHAARTGNAKLVEFFLTSSSSTASWKADPTIANNEGYTPEQIAVKYKKQAVIDVFNKINKGNNDDEIIMKDDQNNDNNSAEDAADDDENKNDTES